MSFRVFWFVVAGFVLGFTTSTLWEWLYYRRKRLRLLQQYGDTVLAVNRTSATADASGSLDVQDWKLPAYRSPGVFLEDEQQLDTPDIASAPLRGATSASLSSAKISPEPSHSRPIAPTERVQADDPREEHALRSASPPGATTEPSTSLSGAPAAEDPEGLPQEPPRSIALAAAAAAAALRETNSAESAKASSAAAQTVSRSYKLDISPPTALAAVDGEASTAVPSGTSYAAQTTGTQTTGGDDNNDADVDTVATAMAGDAGTEPVAPTSLPATGAVPPQETAATPKLHTPSPVETTARKRPNDYPDDLAMVKGIGEAYKRRLYATRIYTWRQLAECDIDSLRRITRAKPNADIASWQTQARDLAAKHQRLQANFTGPLDDFTRIEGIGAITADTLYKAGICTYEQLMETSPDELARIVPAPTVGNENDFEGWIADAGKLAAAKRRNNGRLP
ncbi:MAG: helix-hairpin-helix domain-containing protein [Caldilineaceae bacterium]